MALPNPKKKTLSSFEYQSPERDPATQLLLGTKEQVQADYWDKVETRIKTALKPEFARLHDTIDAHAKETVRRFDSNERRFDSLDAKLSEILERLDP